MCPLFFQAFLNTRFNFLHSHFNSRRLAVNLSSMRVWYGTSPNSEVCPQRCGHTKLPRGFGHDRKDLRLWNVKGHLCFRLLQGESVFVELQTA